MKVRNLLNGALATMMLVSVAATPAFAATSSSNTGSGNGLRVSPLRSEATIKPGDTHTVTVMVQDVSPNAQTIQAVINDFMPSTDESGSPRLLLNGQPAPSHSLKKITGNIANFTLQPNEQKSVDITITVPQGYPGGGYYGAVRFVPAGVNPTNSVSLSASVASLILVTVPGNYKDQLSIASMDVEQNGHMHSIFSTPKNLEVGVRFQNTGDVQEQPFGKVQVKKGSKVVGSVEINPANSENQRGNVLPASIRKFSAKLPGVGNFGKYTAQGSFGYSNGQLVTASTTFWVIPTGLILTALVVLVVLVVLAVVLPRAMKRHDQGVLRRSGRR